MICSEKQYKAAATLLLGVRFLLPLVLLLLSPSQLGAWGALRTPVQLEMAELLKRCCEQPWPRRPDPALLLPDALEQGFVCPGALGCSGALSPFCRQQRGLLTSSKVGT